ncbi:TPA: ead/Ea22-like family protein [Raoultella planticola]
MTDITELAPAMKAAAELITSGYSRKWIVSHDDETCWVGANDDDGNLTPFIEVSITDWSGNKADNETLARFIALCRPANVLALVEALEKAQTKNELVAGGIAVAEKLHERIAYLEKRLKGTEESLIASTDMVAELEPRTVKLPAERFCPAEYAGSQLWSETEVWNKAITACADALRADGIKVEAE